MFNFLKRFFATLRSERGETLNAMGYDSAVSGVAPGLGVLQYAVPTFYA